MEKIEVSVNDSVKTLEIRQGPALTLQEPNTIAIDGTIDSVRKFLIKRKSEIIQKECHIEVNMDIMEIHLIVDEKNYYYNTINGSLKLNPDFNKFGINTGQQRTSHQLAEFIKMNRYFFDSNQVAMELVTVLMNFEATVEKEIEDKRDNKGNVTQKRNQAVKTNVPENFKLNVPLFIGQDSETIEIEINIDASSLQCSLISPEAMDIIRMTRDKIINEEIGKIEKLTPDLLIVNV